MRGRISKPSDTAKSTRKIAFRLMNAFCGSNANVCISPLSISIALQLLLSGASGNTLQEMIKALDIESSGRDGLAEDYKIAMARLHEEDNGSARVIFSVANLIVANQGVLLHPGFIEFLQRNYAAEAGSANFADPQTVLQINAWVSAKTFGRIPQLFNSLNPSQVLLLANCAYFKAGWATAFDVSQTTYENFFAYGQNAIQVPMMKMSSIYSYYEDRDLQLIELPYFDTRFTMYVLLPARGVSFKHFLAGFGFDQFDRSVAAASSRNGFFAMPRFKFAYGEYLASHLMQLGISEAFTERANFWNMLSPNQANLPFFKIDEVIHKTFIDVNEEGTEAAAATGLVMSAGFPPTLPPFEMIVDCPFMYVITENQSGTILFSGSVQDPSSQGA